MSDDARVKQGAPKTEMQATLSEQVKVIMNDYFNNLKEGIPTNIYGFVLNQTEKALLEVVMIQTKNNQSKTARYLGMSRSVLRKKLKFYGLVG